MKKTICGLVAVLLFAAQPLFSQKVMSLDECKSIAMKNNNAIKNSALEIEESKKNKSAAIAKYFPQVSAGAFVFGANEYLLDKSIDLPASIAAVVPGGLSVKMMEKGNVSYVNLVQPVYAGGRIFYGNKLASLGVEVSQYKNRLSENEVALTTEEQYWQIVCLNSKAVTLAKYEEMLNALLRQVEDANRLGLIMKNDVLKVRQKKSELLLNKSRLDNGRILARMAFCQFIGISYDPEIDFNDEPAEVKPESLYVDHMNALNNRTEFILLKKAVEAEKLKAKMKMGEYLPQVGVGVSAMYYGFDDDKNRFNGMVFGQVKIPVSDWWGGAFELKGQSIRKDITENDLKDKTDLLLLQMQKAWQDLGDGYKQIALSEESLRQAEENLKVTTGSYNNGLVGISDLLEAQAIFQQAQNSVTESKAGYRIKQIHYLQATGR